MEISKRQPIKLIKSSEMIKHFTMLEAIDCMATAFSSLSSGKCIIPRRSIMSTKDESLTFLLKPAFIDTQDRSSIKILTQRNSNSYPGIPTIMGIVLLIDTATGEIVSIMDGEFITSIRTGAASGLATKYFSREDSSHLAVFGCGSQGRSQLEAVNAVRKLEKIWIFDKFQAHAESFIEEMRSKITADITYTRDLSVLKEVDIICTATNSARPLFNKSHLKEGTHINAIGSFKPEMQELDPETIKSARVFLDDREACLNESGDLIDVIKDPGVLANNIIGEIGEVVLVQKQGRTDTNQTTVFKSVGNAIQDLVTANRIFEKSLSGNFGTEIRLYE